MASYLIMDDPGLNINNPSQIINTHTTSIMQDRYKIGTMRRGILQWKYDRSLANHLDHEVLFKATQSYAIFEK